MMRWRLGVWLLLLIAALGVLVGKRESIAHGWLRMAESALIAAERPRLEALTAFTAERFRAAAAGDDPRMIVAAARYLNWIEARRANPNLDPSFRNDLPEVRAGEIDALIRRAATLGADDPVVWSQLALICEHGWSLVPQRDCPAEAQRSIERLAALEPENGWSALFELERLNAGGQVTAGSAPVLGEPARASAIDAALARLAASRRVDGHEAAMLAIYRRIFDAADWPASLVDAQPAYEIAIGIFGAMLARYLAPEGRVVIGEGPPYSSPEVARDMLALVWLLNDYRFVGSGLSSLCRGDLDEPRTALCRDAALALPRGSSLADELIGLRIAIRLAPDADEDAAAARETLRARRWQQAEWPKLFELGGLATPFPDARARITELWIKTGRESDALSTALAEAGLPTTPPAGWTAPGEAHWGP
jgi:hypothetical protein